MGAVGSGAAQTGLLNAFGLGPPSASPPNANSVGRQYQQLINALAGGESTLFGTQNQWAPQYLNLALGEYGNALPSVTNTNVTNTATEGPAAAAAVENVNPGQSALINSMTKTATDQLSLGTQLDPTQVSSINRSVGANWANRGLGNSNPAMLDEALQEFGGGQQLLQQRQGQAAVAANAGQMITNPALALAGGGTNTANSYVGNAGPTIINPAQAYDTFNTAYNANAATNIGNMNTQAGFEAGNISANSSMIEGGLSALGGRSGTL